MTAPHSIFSERAEALEYLSVFTDSGYYGLSNVQVRAICAALRTPARQSGEVGGIGPTDCAEHIARLLRTANVTINDQWEGSTGYISEGEAARLANAIVALRTPARQSGEVEPAVPDRERLAKIICEATKTYWWQHHTSQTANRQWYDAADAVIASFASSPTPQAQTAPPFSRWADTIEAASLTIGPARSKELDALAAEVRSYA